MSLWAHVREQQVPPAYTPTGAPIESNTHPRIYFTAATKAAWAARLEATELRNRLQTIVSRIDAGTFPAAGSSPPKPDSYLYQFHACLRTLVATTHPVTGVTYGQARSAYVAGALASALVDIVRPTESAVFCYDWLYDDLSASDKETLNRLILTSYTTWDGDTKNPLDDGDGMAISVYLLAGLAADPNLDETHNGNVLARRSRLVRMWNYLGLSNACGGRRGGWAQGHTYMAHPDPSNLARTFWRTLEGYRTAYGVDYEDFYTEGVAGPGPRGENGFCGATLYAAWNLWNRSVRTGVSAKTNRFVTDHVCDFTDELASTTYADILSSARYHSALFPEQAGLAQWLLTTYGVSIKCAWTHLLWGRSVTAQSPSVVAPLVAATPINTENCITWRTYQDATNLYLDDTRVNVDLFKYVGGVGGYDRLRNGTFQISRSGPVFPQCGGDTHSSQYWTDPTTGTALKIAMQNYQYGGNGIQVIDPLVYDGPTTTTDEDHPEFGTRNISGGELLDPDDLTDGSVYDRGGIARQRTTSPYFAEGDITRSYNSTIIKSGAATAKVSLVARRFLFIPRVTATGPDFLVTHDFVTRASTAMQVQWKLRYPADFTVSAATSTAGVPARLFNPTGIQTEQHTGATLITGQKGSSATGTVGVNANSYTTILQPSPATVVTTKRLGPSSPNPYSPNTTNGGYGYATPWGNPMPLTSIDIQTVSFPWLGFGHADIVAEGADLAHRFFVVMEIASPTASSFAMVESLPNWVAGAMEFDPLFESGPMTDVDACRIASDHLVLASQSAWTASAAPSEAVYANATRCAVTVDVTSIYTLVFLDAVPSRTYSVTTYDPTLGTFTRVTSSAAADSAGVLVVTGVPVTSGHAVILQ